MEYLRLIGIQFMGENNFVERQGCQTVDSKGTLFSLIRFCVLAKLLSDPRSVKPWKTKLRGSRSLLNIMNWIVLMENQSCSSGNVYPGHTQHSRYFGKSKERWRKTKFRLNSLKVGSSSCRCTMTWIVETKKRRHLYVEFFRCCCVARRFPEGHWSFLGPGTEEK